MKTNLKKIIFAVLFFALILLVFFNKESLRVDLLADFLVTLGVWAPFAFIIVYSIVPVLFIPGTLLTVLAGFVFGFFWGTVYSVIGATIGSTLAFLTARYIASDWVEKHSHGSLSKIKQGVERQGWRYIAFTRLVPIFPFTILNHIFGLTKISALTYAVSTFIFIIPTTIAYVYIGHVGQEATKGSQDLLFKAAVVLVLLLLLSLVPRFSEIIAKKKSLTKLDSLNSFK